MPFESPRPDLRRGRSRSKAWVAVASGLYRPVDAPDVADADLRAWSDLLPESACFTHLTAARRYGWACPPIPHAMPVHAAAGRTATRIRRPGLRLLRSAATAEPVRRAGLALAAPLHTLLACARDLGLADLVVLVDSAVRCGDVSVADIAAARGGWGAVRLRSVLPYVDARAESAWESLLRLLHTCCDVPVECQFRVPGTPFRADLLITGTRRLPEYDGDRHREAARHAHDLDRERELQRRGWQRYGYNSHVLLRRPVSILRDADEALGRQHEPVRIRPWYDALAESLFTPAGTAAVLRRTGACPAG